jgi:hypothetical protein
MSMQAFIEESNRIEGIGFTTAADRAAHSRLWDLDVISIPDIDEFVAAVAGAELRDRPGMDVVVADHRPPPGGVSIRATLEALLRAINSEAWNPHAWHCAYETLHPYTDGNGRSGRALWAWQMMRRGRDPFALGFLHAFYYQTLDQTRKAVP